MGTGSANVEVETFSGDVEMIRASELKPATIEDDEDRPSKLKVRIKSKVRPHDRDDDRNQGKDR